jgi:hypothetical protein
MNTLIAKKEDKAISVWFTEDMLYVRLTDGREIGSPLAWFPSLLNAPNEQRNNFRFIGGGSGIHWNELDEDLSISGLL